MSRETFESFGRVVWEYSWLIADAVVLFMVFSLILGYGELDANGRALLRILVVGLWFYVWVSGFHLLLFIRHVDNARPGEEKIFPWWKSFSCYLSKGLIIVAVGVWAYCKGLLS